MLPLSDVRVLDLSRAFSPDHLPGKDPGRLGNAHPSIMPCETFHAGDKMIAVAVGNDLQFRALCEVIERKELADNERFATNPARVTNRERLGKLLSEEFAKKPAQHWIVSLQAAGVPCGPVNSLADVFEDPHLRSSGLLQKFHHPTAGNLETVASPILIDGDRLPIRLPPPLLGQRNQEVE